MEFKLINQFKVERIKQLGLGNTIDQGHEGSLGFFDHFDETVQRTCGEIAVIHRQGSVSVGSLEAVAATRGSTRRTRYLSLFRLQSRQRGHGAQVGRGFGIVSGSGAQNSSFYGPCSDFDLPRLCR